MAYKKISGVYKIFCSGNGKHYVGSAVSIKQRWASHLCQLRKNRHKNLHLQNSWNKYGAGEFHFSIIELCSVGELIATEQRWIEALDAANPAVGLNNSWTASTSIGYRHSEQTKQRLSEIGKAKDHTRLRKLAEKMRGMPPHNLGKPGLKWTEERKAAASAARKGMIAWNKGIPMADEVKKRVSLSVIKSRRVIPDSVRERIKKLRSAGYSYPKISASVGVSVAQAHRIANDFTGANWRARSAVKGEMA